jgi:transposase
MHTDDTRWRVGSELAYLMVFETAGATVYRIRPCHCHEEVQEVIPADYDAVLVTDRGCSYEAQAFDGVPQQKCLAHIQRSISDVVETKTGRARNFGEQLKGLLQEAMELWHAYRDGQRTDYKAEPKPCRPK